MCVRSDVRPELADPVGDGSERRAVDLERVVPEVEALELGAERCSGSFRLAVPDLLHALHRLPGLLPELAGLSPLAVGEREHARFPAGRCRNRDRASRPPDEVGGVRADDEQPAASHHSAPPGLASCRDRPTIIS